MKIVIGTITGLLLAGLYCAQPVQAQGWPGYQSNQPYGYQTQPYGYQSAPYRERREGSGSSMDERCVRLHRETQDLRVRMDREWNPIDRARIEGRLHETREREARAGCR